MKQKLQALAVILALCIFTVTVAATDQPSGATVESSTDEGDYTDGTAGTVDVTSGHIYRTELDTNMSTYRWGALYGNVTGTIVLGDDDDDRLFEWTAAGRLVYASDSEPTWSSLTDATVEDMDAYIEGAFTDNYTTTFDEASENIGSGIFETLTSDFAYTYDNVGVDTWKTYSLKDGEATPNLVWVGKVDEDGTSYKNTVADYQMIVPEDGTDGDETATTYNLWVELI